MERLCKDGGNDRKRIDHGIDLQRIKKANNNVENEELEYQIRAEY
jgi:hypothetical protein